MTTTEKLNRIVSVLEDIDIKKRQFDNTYGRTGRKIPATKWNRETHEYENVYDENGEQVFEDEWDNIPNENLTEEQKYEVMLWVDIETNFKKEIAKLLS